MRTLLILFLLSTSIKMHAQSPTPEGIYYLEGVMETASGFKLDKDSTFEFFFSQGALDRTGKGSWKQNGELLTFQSPGILGPGFILQKSSKEKHSKIVVIINEPNSMLLSFIYVRLYEDDKSEFLKMGTDGRMEIESDKFTKIEFLFELCPERTYSFEKTKEQGNYFEFTIDPGIMDVYFDNLVYKIEGDYLKGKHPLLRGEEFLFLKEKR